MRISIIGHSSSGKSTLAKKLSEKFNIPHLQIDRFWFESGGAKLKRGDKEGNKIVKNCTKEKVLEFIKQNSWVSDGWYSKIQPIISEKADYIIFLDIPLHRRLFNHLLRIIKTNRHKELKKWDDVTYFYDIVRKTFNNDKSIREFALEHSNKVKTFKNYNELEKFIKSL